MTRNEMLELMAHHIYILTETTIEDATSTADQILTAQEQAGMVLIRRVIDGESHTWEAE